MLGNELCPGSQHCSNGVIEFTQRCINKAEQLGLQAEELLIRADSGQTFSCEAEIVFRFAGHDLYGL